MKCGFCGSEAVLVARPAKSLYLCPKCRAISFVDGTCWSRIDRSIEQFRDATKTIGKAKGTKEAHHAEN